MTITLTAFEAQLAADYAAKAGVSLDEAAEVLADMRDRMAGATTSGPVPVVRTVNCPECHTRHQSELTVETGDDGATTGFVACPECGVEAFYPVRLRKDERG